MAKGFSNKLDFLPLIGWELHQVTIDKFHVMFLFNNGWNLLNVANAFSHRSKTGGISYTYSIYEDWRRNEVARILREKVVDVQINKPDRLTLIFSNGDEIDVHDHPDFCSWWFIPIDNPDDPNHKNSWAISDIDPDFE